MDADQAAVVVDIGCSPRRDRLGAAAFRDRSLERDEQAAVGALEPVVAGRRPGQELLAELLAAMWAAHLVDRRVGGFVGHSATVPAALGRCSP